MQQRGIKSICKFNFYVMYVIISPSKTQDFERELTLPEGVAELSVVSEWNEQTKELSKVMKNFSADELGVMMKISPKLAELNFNRFQKWDGKYGNENFYKPAIVAFLGDVYKGFGLDSWRIKDCEYANSHLGIISGFYGLINPLNYIQPYRLEMGTRITFSSEGIEYKNLYEFWKERLTEKIIEILKTERILLNLASVEYSKVIDRKIIAESGIDEVQVVDVDFKINKVNVKTNKREERVVAIYAKRARGLMANWIVENEIDSLEALEQFKEDGWKFKGWGAEDALGNKRALFVKRV